MIHPKQILSNRKVGSLEEHFITPAALLQVVGPKGSIAYVDSAEASHPGVVKLQGTNKSGGWAFLRTYNNFLFGSDAWEFNSTIRIGNTPVTEGGIFRFGFISITPDSVGSDGVWLQVDNSQASNIASWVVSVGGVLLSTTPCTYSLATWNDITIKVASSLQVAVNKEEKVLVLPPTLLTTSLGVGLQVVKSVGSSVPCVLDVDYVRLAWSLR